MKIIPCDTFEEAKKIVEDYDQLCCDMLDVAGYPVDYVWWKSYPTVLTKYKVAHFNTKEKKLYIYEE